MGEVVLVLVEDSPAFSAKLAKQLADQFGPQWAPALLRRESLASRIDSSVDCQVHRADCLASCQELLSSIKVDMVVADVHLPDGSFPDWAASNRSLLSGKAVIMYTAYLNKSLKQKCSHLDLPYQIIELSHDLTELFQAIKEQIQAVEEQLERVRHGESKDR